ncbi:histidine phosphatase family protein [Actinomadura rayongensis]|nr:histidine phosphatase family protein [Actinomadura rayongensis]
MPATLLIRHGESESNAGLPTYGPGAAPLTALGRAQAATIAESFTAPPSLLVVSPFLRARETAAPTRARFPSVPCEEWPVQEFTYLGALHGPGTSIEQRRPHAAAYWARADPSLVLGGDGESFTALIARARAFLDRLSTLPDDATVAVFTHRIFLLAVTWTLDTGTTTPDSPAMRAFHHYAESTPTPNACIRPLALPTANRTHP